MSIGQNRRLVEFNRENRYLYIDNHKTSIFAIIAEVL